MTGASSIRQILAHSLANDPNLLVVGGDVGKGGGPFGMTAGLLGELGPERIFDLPAADRGAAGIALGMALAGKRVVLVLDGAGRLGAILDVLRSAAAFAASNPIGLVVLAPYGTEAGPLDAPAGFAARIPGISVVAASSAGRLGSMLTAAIAANRPVVLLAPRAALVGRGDAEDAALDRASVLHAGDHVTLAAWGGSVADALAAASSLADEGISAEVLDLVTLAPIDAVTLGASVRRTGRLVVVHPSDDALALDPASVGLEAAFEFLESPIRFAATADAAATAARESVAW